MQNESLFTESQKFNQWWVIAIMIIVTLLVLGAVTFMALSRLDTEIKRDGVYVRYYPAHIKFKRYAWEDISRIYVREYSPLTEYGGWGIRGSGKDRVLNVSGKMGLQLELKNGEKLLIGTRRPDEINETLKNLGH